MQRVRELIDLLEKEIALLELPKQPTSLYDPVRYFMNLGGKRMRPVLTLLATELFGKGAGSSLSAALAVEVFHNFTLIHDDIMDKAPLRRSQQTVHEKWSTNHAILSGDVMLVKAYDLLAEQHPEHVRDLLLVFNKTAREVCEGQQMDMDFEQRHDVRLEEYLEMIRLKTSVLLGAALEMGGIIANANKEDRERIYQFGVELGLAFQIQDDLLDLYAEAESFGKQVGGDVIANKRTVLHLKALEMATPQQHEILFQLQREEDLEFKVDRTRVVYNQIGVPEACIALKEKHHYNAMTALESISVSEDQKAPLKELASYLLNRSV